MKDGAAKTPLLSIVTGTRDRPEALERFVGSVLAHTRCDFELLIGDASAVPHPPFDDPRIRVVPEPEPLGFVRGYNALFRQVRGELVCFLNDDLVVLPEWDTRALAVLERHPEVAMVCLPVIEPSEPDPFIALVRKIPFACFGIVRREVGDALGWFDERYKFYSADPDFTLRLVAAGYLHAPALGRLIEHRVIVDAGRRENEADVEPSKALFSSIWRSRIHAVRKSYRRQSFRYFQGLALREVPSYGGKALDACRPGDARVRPLVAAPRNVHYVPRRWGISGLLDRRRP